MRHLCVYVLAQTNHICVENQPVHFNRTKHGRCLAYIVDFRLFSNSFLSFATKGSTIFFFLALFLYIVAGNDTIRAVRVKTNDHYKPLEFPATSLHFRFTSSFPEMSLFWHCKVKDVINEMMFLKESLCSESFWLVVYKSLSGYWPKERSHGTQRGRISTLNDNSRSWCYASSVVIKVADMQQDKKNH